MKLFYCLFFLVLSFSGSFAFAGDWKGFDEGFRAAKAGNLPVIVDFSADWCGWCKKMDKDVFSRKDVAARLASETVTVRIDTESPASLTYKGKRMTIREFTTLMRIEGLPTLMVFNPQGDKLTELVGYVDAKYFLLFLDYLKKKKYSSMSFQTYLGQGGK
jgi:thioredoxin-related protein